jgi:hypothetical protein
MSNINQFPQARLDQMGKAAAEFDPRDFRADALSPRATQILQVIDPSLAYKIATGTMRPGAHKDASESVFFSRQLEFIRPGLFEVLYPNLQGKELVPLETNIAPGAETYTYRAINKVGRAQLLKNYSDDIPRADVTGVESSQQIKGAGVMYGYTMQELRAAMMAGMPLDVRKAMAARYTLALLQDEVLFYGHADTVAAQSATGLDSGALEGGLKGLANLSGTTSYTVALGSGGSKLWSLKTADEIVADMHGIVNNVITTTLGVHMPDTLALPLLAWNIAATKRMGDGSNQTCLDFFLATSPTVKQVKSTYRLDAARSGNWSGTTGRMIAYEANPERLVGLMPVEFEQLPPQNEHFEIRTACHARMGGVVPFYPLSISYGDGIS